MGVKWDHLRVVLTVSREGGLSAAARALGVNQATVSRQLARAEEEIGARLFNRLNSGLSPTRAGLSAIAAALRAEAEIVALEVEISGLSEDIAGPVRLSVPIGVVAHGLAADIAAFQRLYPDVSIQIESDDGVVNLGERKADIAIRAQDKPAAGLWGHKLADVEYQYYGSAALHEEWASALRPGSPEAATAAVPLVDFAGAPQTVRDEFRAVFPRARAAAACTSVDALLPTIEDGVGFAICACFIARAHPNLRRVSAVASERSKGLWILTHPDLRRSTRYRVFMDFVRDRYAARRETFASEAAA